MIQFLLPAALLAAAGIIVPILLHLWRPPARTVRLGSLRFLNSVPGRRLRDLRWRDRLLLLLRVAVLLALAALLAQPFWIHRTSGLQRWALLIPGSKLEGPSLEAWNNLLAEGYEPRWLVAGFPNANASVPSTAPVDAWSLLRDADARVPPGSKLALFAPANVSTLRGERPAPANSDVTWIVSGESRSVLSADWLDSLFVSRNGQDLNANIGTSGSTSTRFSRLRLPVRAKALSSAGSGAALEIKPSGDGVVARLPAETPPNWMPARMYRPLRVAIVHATERAEDARYVAAAVRAVGEISDRELSLTVRAEADSKILPEADWIFRLGVAPLPEAISRALAENNVNVVSDAPADATEQNRASWFVAPNEGADVNGVRLWKRVAPGREPGVAVWSDGFGESLLILAREGRAERWRFFSRFHPEWNDWVRGGSFPGWIRSLLLRDGTASPRNIRDRRTADLTQLQPARRATPIDGASLPAPAERRADLHLWNWVLLASLMAAERILSLRSMKSRASDAAKASPSQPEIVEVAP